MAFNSYLLVFRLIRLILWPWGSLPKRLFLRLHRRTRTHGLSLIDLTGFAKDNSHTDTFFQKFAEALQLIGDYDPRRLARIQRDLNRIILIPEGAGHYDNSLRAYWTDLRVLAQPVWRIATFIVHEAIHARLGASGVKHRAASKETHEDWERRVETLCVHEEISFARRFTDSAEVFEYLQQTLDTKWWDEDKMRDRERRALRSVGVPEGLIRALSKQPRQGE